jgi:hypothetical protein
MSLFPNFTSSVRIAIEPIGQNLNICQINKKAIVYVRISAGTQIKDGTTDKLLADPFLLHEISLIKLSVVVGLTLGVMDKQIARDSFNNQVCFFVTRNPINVISTPTGMALEEITLSDVARKGNELIAVTTEIGLKDAINYKSYKFYEEKPCTARSTNGKHTAAKAKAQREITADCIVAVIIDICVKVFKLSPLSQVSAQVRKRNAPESENSDETDDDEEGDENRSEKKSKKKSHAIKPKKHCIAVKKLKDVMPSKLEISVGELVVKNAENNIEVENSCSNIILKLTIDIPSFRQEYDEGLSIV